MEHTQEAIANIAAKTPTAALVEKSPTIATVKKYWGETKMKAVVKYFIESVSSCLNVGKGLNEFQVEIAADMVFESYYYYKISEIKLVFKKGLKGDFGTLYDRLDPQIIMDWFRQYDELRTGVKEYARMQEQKETAFISSESWEAIVKVNQEMHRMIEKRERDKREASRKEVDLKYKSIEGYCKDKGIDHDEYAAKLFEKWKPELEKSGESEEKFYQTKYYFHLAELNASNP